MDNNCFSKVCSLSPKFATNMKIKTACKLVDEFIEDLDLMDDTKATANYVNNEITLTIFCDEIVLEHGRKNSFCDMLPYMKHFELSRKNSDTLRVDLSMPLE